MKRLFLVLASTAVLVACGGEDSGTAAMDGGGTGGGGQGGVPPTGAAPSNDRFVNDVAAIIDGNAANTEPVSVQSYTVTAPEDTQPVPLG